MSALNRKLFRDLLHLRGQVIAVALVVACGVSSFVLFRNTYRSLLATKTSYYSEYRFADVFAQAKRVPKSILPRISEIPGVAVVQPRIVSLATVDFPEVDQPASGLMISIPEHRTQILNDLHLERGRYIEPGKRDEIIISTALADRNGFEPGDTLSAVINGKWTRLRIVGTAISPEFIYEIRPGDLFPDNKHFGVIWISVEALESAFNMEGAFNDLAISLSPGANEQQVITLLDALLREYGGLGAFGRADQTSNFFITNELAELQVSGTIVPAIFLGVTAFLIHLVLSRLVRTQRDQVAVLKAFGFYNSTIGWHFLKLALLTVSGGVALGTLVGWYFGYQLTELYAEFFRFPVLEYEMSAPVLLIATLISLGAASIGALRAVDQAVALPPAEAMRPEAPARYRASLPERLGLRHFLPLSIRIIIRNLERNLTKAVLTILGIALSVSLLIVGFYFFDAIDQIILIQFKTVNREDANVIFNEPRPARTKFEMQSMPGVMKVEPYRMVPVRLRNGHLMRRAGLLGLDPEGELERLVDKDFRIFELPPEGLVLTAWLGESLGVRPGDTLTIEVLEGERLVIQAPVVDLVDEVLGMSAYMNLHALNRLLREGGTISGTRLMVDDAGAATLYGKLKRTPAVGGVLIPNSVLENFNETLARTMGTSTFVIILFASIIAFGMVYNGARISLSERGRELASLRVLGFTKREIGVMLLGEQAILTLLAIPAGYGLGFWLCYLLIKGVDSELIRMPLVISGKTYALTFLIIVCAAILSGLLVAWRLRRLDLIEVLKTRE
ncbi:MAG: FtsX-like permease family protein [Acidobacteriota bacterium]|nr:MAG: FtsX-like permease family protein [Acidobacteriota bacterium]